MTHQGFLLMVVSANLAVLPKEIKTFLIAQPLYQNLILMNRQEGSNLRQLILLQLEHILLILVFSQLTQNYF